MMHLVLVSGLSGSGKSIALRVLEDEGYYCVDNLPANLLGEVVDQLGRAGHERVAVSVDARSASLGALPERIAHLRERGIGCKLVFLEADAPSLVRRFSETRRRHPLAGATRTLEEAIAEERSHLADVAELGHHLDTSDLAPQILRRWIKELLDLPQGAVRLLLQSFAYRDGVPLDADWVFDARMLPNPHYDPALRPLTGRDAPVQAFLAGEESVGRLLEDLKGLIERWLPEIAREHRHSVSIAIGCTGGQHRSVYLVERLAAHFRTSGNVLVRHRVLDARRVERA